jgi:5-methylcytosine-specific restriction endonuclease McrA
MGLTKLCRKCREHRPLEDFPLRRVRNWIGPNAWCRECLRNNQRDWRARNPEKVDRAHKEWAERNPDKIHRAEKEWRERNPEKARENWRQWKERNPERVRENYRVWAAANPERLAQRNRLQRAQRVSAAGTHTQADIEAIFALQRGRCAYCRRSVRKGYHVDHIVPLSKGGTNDRRNLQLACAACNVSKKDRDPIRHAQRLGRLL